MSNSAYKVWAWGNAVGIGASAPLYVGIAGVAKAASQSVPATVSNELICGSLGRAVCLPIPPGFLVDKGGVPYYVSLDFNLSGQSLPPADPQALVTAQPAIAAGVVLFDLWIVNPDRHPQNIAFDTIQNRVNVFDHSHAFMMGQNGIQVLKALQNALPPGGHCLAPHLSSFQHMKEWYERINDLPRYLIEYSVDEAVGFGVDGADRDFAVQYLIDRRQHLRDMVISNPKWFPKAQSGTWV
jgi:hypothetical protein